MKQMRFSLLLTFLSVVLAFMAGYLFLALSRSLSQVPISIYAIHDLTEKFRESYRPIAEINLRSLLPDDATNSLIDVEESRIKLNRYSFSQIQNFYKSNSSCSKMNVNLLDNSFFKKAQTWIDFKCQKIERLPSDFFKKTHIFFR